MKCYRQIMLIAPKLEAQKSLRGCLDFLWRHFCIAVIRHGVCRCHETTFKVDEHSLIDCESLQFIGVLFKIRIKLKFVTEKSI